MKKTASVTTQSGIEALLALVRTNEQGLVPTVIQDDAGGEVITLCYMNAEALRKSLEEGKVYVFRRSQNRLMLKGETSGHIQIIRQVSIDCEGKSLVFRVRQKVAGCHTGFFTCYYRVVSKSGKVAARGKRIFDPEKVYKAL